MRTCHITRVISILLFVIILFNACSRPDFPPSSSQESIESSLPLKSDSPNFAADISEAFEYNLYKQKVFEDFSDSNSLYGKQFGEYLDEAYQDGVYQIYIYQAETWAAESPDETLLLLINFGGRAPFSPWILLADQGGQISYEQIGTGMEAEFCFGDIDGDRLNEIIAWTSYGNGGSGAYENVLYRLENGILCEIYRGDYKNYPIDTGFELLLNDGYQYTIQNKITGYNITFTDTTNHAITKLHFEENGTVSEWIKKELPYPNGENIRNFLCFRPLDVDGDGICEIEVKERFSFTSVSGGIGLAISALKYDSATNTLTPVKSGFWPDAYNDTDLKAKYEQNWWR